MSSVAAPRLAGRRPPAARCKDLLLGPPKPRHEVLVLVDGLNRAVLHALQYAHQLNPLSFTAVHVAADPGTAARLSRLGDRGRFGRLLHDQTGRDLFASLNRLAGVNVGIVHPPAPVATPSPGR